MALIATTELIISFIFTSAIFALGCTLAKEEFLAADLKGLLHVAANSTLLY